MNTPTFSATRKENDHAAFLQKMGIAPEKIILDFIAVLPQYEWSVEKHGGVEVGTERRTGFRMQTNVHLAAKDESEAQAVINRAFEEGVTDIIAFGRKRGQAHFRRMFG